MIESVTLGKFKKGPEHILDQLQNTVQTATMKTSTFCRVLLATLLLCTSSKGQTASQITLAFSSLRSDDIPGNGSAACEWLFGHRDRLKDVLEEELYRTDRQGRDAITWLLFNVDGFKPNRRFQQLVMARINEEDHFVANSDLHLGVHWAAWAFIDRNYEVFKSPIIENLASTRNMLCVWASVWMLARHGDLEKQVEKFPQRLWDLVAANLKDDDQSYNAGQAVRYCLTVGKPSIPHLQALQNAQDKQTRSFSTALIDAMNGSRDAYGYLGAHVSVSFDLLNGGVGEPDWMFDAVQKHMQF